MSKPRKGKRFRYKLQTLLKVRGIREKQEKEKLREKEKIVKEEKKKEAALKETQRKEYLELTQMMTKGELPDMNKINMRKHHLEKLKEEVDNQVKKRQEAEEARDSQREVLTQATKEKRVIEKDREKTREAWRKLMDREESKFLDDIASVGFDRKKRK